MPNTRQVRKNDRDESYTNQPQAGERRGTVYQRPGEDRWAWVILGPDGQRIAGYAKTQAEALRPRDEARRRSHDGLPVADSSITVAAYMESWLNSARPARPDEVGTTLGDAPPNPSTATFCNV